MFVVIFASPNNNTGDQSQAFANIFRNNYHTDDDDDGDMLNNDKCSYIQVSDIATHLSPEAFNLLSFNARSLPGCVDNLKDFLADSASDLFAAIGVQEVWSAKKSLSLPGYKPLYYNTRDQNSAANPNIGGGVGIYIREGLNSEVLHNLSNFTTGVYESIWVKVKPNKLKKSKSIIVASVYRPNSAPRASITRALEIHSSILQSIKTDKTLKNCKIVILSDFNLDLLEFESNRLVNDYLDIHFSHGLIPSISKSAHITSTTAKVIDHIFSNSLQSPTKSGVLLLSISDHLPTFFSDSSIIVQKPLKPEPFRLINKSTTDSYLKLLGSAKFCCSEDDPKTSFNSFFEQITAIAEVAFPLVTPKSVKKKAKNNPWTTYGLRISAVTRNILFASMRKFPSEVNKLAFKCYNSIYNKVVKRAKRQHYLEAFKTVKGDLKKSWLLVNEITGRKKGGGSRLPDSFISSVDPNVELSSQSDIANGFNQFFNTIGPKLSEQINSSHLPWDNFRKYLPKKPDHSFKFHPISPSYLLIIVKKMKSKSSYGDDYMSNVLLKKSIHILLTPLTNLINISMATGFVPDQIKVAKVIPLFKEGSTLLFNNYRPIAIVSTIGKLLEKVVCNQLSNYLDNDCLLHPNQFGFRANHNVTHPLILFSNRVLNSKSSNLLNLTIFLDLKKAFDTVNWTIILDKLKNFGIQNTEWNWFESYLQRKQYTMAGKTASQVLSMLCGLPQGTSLAPLLFLLYINDLPHASAFFTLLFADDTTLQLEGESIEQLLESATQELIKIQDWFISNRLTLNIKKTSYMIFFPESETLTYPALKMGNSTIQRVGSNLEEQSIRFLGVWVDDHLNFSQHILKIRVKLVLANYQLSQCKVNTPLDIKLGIYHSLFESHIRFGAVLFGTAPESDLKVIFTLQKKALRTLSNSHFRAHTNPLFHSLRILKLDDLLKLERILIVHKFKHGRLPKAFPHNFLPPVDPSALGRRDDVNDFAFPHPLTKATIRLPTNLMISSWNSLPPELKATGDIKIFKKTFIDSSIESYNTTCSLQNCFSCGFIG